MIRVVTALLAMMPVLAWAQGAVLMRADHLRAEPYTDALAVSAAAAGDIVRVVEQKGTWIRVELAGKRGWVRALNLKSDGAVPMRAEGVAALQTGREARGGMAVPLAVRGVLGPAGRVLKQVFDARAQQQHVRIEVPRVGSSSMVTVDAGRSGYLYVFVAGATGETIQCLYPNALQPDNDYKAGDSVQVNVDGSMLAEALSRNPRGAAKLLAFVSSKPVDLLLPGKELEGSLFRVTVNPASRGELVRALSGECDEATCRSYDAAMIDVPQRL